MGLGSIRKVFKSVTKVFKAVKASSFLKNINPFVALGVFVVGWLFVRSMRNPEVPEHSVKIYKDSHM